MKSISRGSDLRIGWAVVYVMAGVPVDVKIFEREETATLYEQELRARMNPENDETGIFEVTLENSNPINLQFGAN